MAGQPATGGLLGDLDALGRVGVVGNRTDAELLLLYRSLGADSEPAFRSLVVRHGPMVLDVCRAVLRDPHDAQDAFQATFLILASRAASIQHPDSLGGWLRGVARRVAKRARAQNARRRATEGRAAESRTRDVHNEPGAWSELHEEIDRLPGRYREPVILCYLRGLSTDAAARQLGCPKGTVLSRLSRARERLRDSLTRRGMAITVLPAMPANRPMVMASSPAAIAGDLLSETVRACLAFAKHPKTATAPGLATAEAVALAKGVLSTMFDFRLRVLGVAAVACTLAAGGAGVSARLHGGQATNGHAPGSGPVASQSPASPLGKVPSSTRRTIKRFVRDFPEKLDLSTPEAAQAAWYRAAANANQGAMRDISWTKWSNLDIAKAQLFRKEHPDEARAVEAANRDAEILEVDLYREDIAGVISRLNFPAGSDSRDPYSLRIFGKIGGVWKNLGEDRLPSLEAARRRSIESEKVNLKAAFDEIREKLEKGVTPLAEDQSPRKSRAALIAPGEPHGISTEKAELIGRIEWVFRSGASDVTARKSLEWGDVERDAQGNRTIRYKFLATLHDRLPIINDQVFVFDGKGNLLDVKDVEGFPKPAPLAKAEATQPAPYR